MITAPVTPEFTARDDPALGPGSRVYRFACAHGVSSALVMDGAGAVEDGVVLDLLLAGHRRASACGCQPSRPGAGHGSADS